MSSYQPELHGILVMLMILNAIVEAFLIPPTVPVLLVCDNEGATLELTKLVTMPDYTLDPKQTDCNLLLEIQGALQCSTSSFTVQWV